MIELKGITWNHTRGYLPMVATAQRFMELHPDVSIRWDVRSLQAFADAPLAKLASEYDLLVIDHPSMGEAAEHGLFAALEDHVPGDFLADQFSGSVGRSSESYDYEGHVLAIAIDAATPVAGWRPDLLANAGAEVPSSWEEVLGLARMGLVTIPAIPIDSLMNLFMLANALGAEPFRAPDEVISRSAGVRALQLLREIVMLSAPGSLERNPIRTWQLLADSNRVAYCPFAYGYSNYSRRGYGAHTIQAGDIVSFEGKQLCSTLGGAGLAISRNCKEMARAASYVQFVADPSIQQTLYAFSGGQPGHRSAWLNQELNAATLDFFRNTLATLDRAWMRPRFAGFIQFQDTASQLVHHYLAHGGDEVAVLHQMNDALRQVRKTDS